MAAFLAVRLLALGCLGVFACGQASGSEGAPTGAPAPTGSASAPLGSAPALATSLAALSTAGNEGFEQLANFYRTPLAHASASAEEASSSPSNLSASAFTIPITFHPYGIVGSSNQAPPPAAATAGRRLLQSNCNPATQLCVNQANLQDVSWTANVTVQDGAGAFQGPFAVRMDTGSSNYLIPFAVPPTVPGFSPNGLPAVNTNLSFSFGGGQTSETGSEYSATTRFAGLPATTTANTSVFAVDIFNPATNALGPNPYAFPLGLGITTGVVVGGVRQVPLIQSMYNQGVITQPAFTIVFNEFNPVLPLPQPLGGSITLGPALPVVPELQNTDVQCAPVVPPPPGDATEWVVALQQVSASQNSPAPLGPNTFNFCTPTSGCSALIDSATFDIALPPELFPSLFQLLGLPANPALVGGDITGRQLISAAGYPALPCSAQTRPGPTIDFQIQDRVYSLSPANYIYKWNNASNGTALSEPKCAAVFQPSQLLSSPNVGGPYNFFILGDPFMFKFPETFLGPGIINTTLPRGVAPHAPRTPAEGTPGGAEEEVCFYGTVPVLAVCAPTPITLPVTDPATCAASISPAALLNLTSYGNRVAAFLDAAGNSSVASTVYTLQPPPPPASGTYVFPGGQNATIQLTATTPTAPVSVNSCTATVAVPLTPPRAVCAPALTLPASAGCAAHPTPAQLQAAIDAGSSQGSGGPLNLTLSPPAPPGGAYALPVGTYPITLTVANCAGSSSCSTLVTVDDQEKLAAANVSCGALPSSGVLQATALGLLTAPDPLAVFAPSYAKANGCPTALFTDNLACKDCLLGSSLDASHGRCDSRITSKGVAIGAKQLARVSWTVTVTDQAGGEAMADCAVCVDQVGTALGHCPRPFTPATPCQTGSL